MTLYVLIMVLYVIWGMKNMYKNFLFLYVPQPLLVNIASFGYLFLFNQVDSDLEFQFYVPSCD